MSKQTLVFLIEDDQDLMSVLAELLSSNGVKVIQFSNLTGVLERATSEKPDFIITDLYLPGNSELAVFQILQEEKLNIPLILITGEDPPEELLNQRIQLLKKPFSFDLLLEILKRK